MIKEALKYLVGLGKDGGNPKCALFCVESQLWELEAIASIQA